jgi:16S rRNA G966 N2-methylase RsmD
METEAAETCPCCEGTPQRLAISCGPDGCRETVSTCDLCGGSGIIASEAAARYRKGHALREHRVRKLGFTQKELAELLGTSPVLLNHVEHGRADMPDQQWRRFEELSRTLA